jgi:hypothetical protein
MATTIDWPTKVINIPRADLQLVQETPTEIRQLSLDVFRLILRGLEASLEGIPYLQTHNHTPPVSVGSVQLARVVELINNYTVTFEDGQYAVNIIGGNSNIGDFINVNQVSVRTANSAGLTYSKEIEDQAFTDARIYIDSEKGLPGTIYPQGVPGRPVATLQDAQTIIETRNLPKRISLTGNINLTSDDDVSEYDIAGASSNLASIIADTGANTMDMVITNLTLIGDLNGNISARSSSSLVSLNNFDGELIDCGIDGIITLGQADDTVNHEFIDCYSQSEGDTYPIIDAQGLDGLSVKFVDYSGALAFRNFNQPSNVVTVNLGSGAVLIDSSCTAGTFVIRGTGNLIDESGEGCTVITSAFAEGTDKATEKIWSYTRA